MPKIIILEDGKAPAKYGNDEVRDIYNYYYQQCLVHEQENYPADDEEDRQIKERALHETAEQFGLDYRTVKSLILVTVQEMMKWAERNVKNERV